MFSPYGSSYTIDLEALQDVVVGLLWNLVFDIDDQALIAVVNDNQVSINKIIYQITSVNLFINNSFFH